MDSDHRMVWHSSRNSHFAPHDAWQELNGLSNGALGSTDTLFRVLYLCRIYVILMFSKITRVTVPCLCLCFLGGASMNVLYAR